jgi:polysaccharide pyruvyl transferase WcaK-like protein
MKTFIVTGIQMRNKGSQAMFLSLYSALKSKYTDCDVVGFASKYDSPEQYKFRLLPFDNYTRLLFEYRLQRVPFLASILTYSVSKFRDNDKWAGKISEMERALQNADAIFDASGYALGSGWPKQSGMALLQTIRIARKYGKKIILMPQSFGPFDWGEKDDASFLEQVKEGLTYPSRIYAREKEGYECLTSLGLDNVELSADLVIREKLFPTAGDIFYNPEARVVEYPPRDSVGFIINRNLFRIGDAPAVLELYTKILQKLIDTGEKVCILNTSTADIDLVEDILKGVTNRDKLDVITGEYSSPELIDIISRFKYVVASRYHSVVFAYRSGVPAVILGWASKYDDLAALFQQQDYVFDIRSSGVERIITQIDTMSANYKVESQRIKESLEIIQAGSVVQQAMSYLQE